jgi:hypothetical protein
MSSKPGIGLVCVLLMAGFGPGCKPRGGPESGAPVAYFQTPFQTEPEFIVQSVVSDLAEQMTFAASHRLPDAAKFSVRTQEKRGSPADAPVYELRVRLGSKQDLKTELNVNGPIWSPSIYQGVAGDLARMAGLKGAGPTTADDTALLTKLLDSAPETIEEENQRVSASLEKDFADAEWHEEAAMVLGAFLLRDHSGPFFEIRSPLCRMTAHLTMAHFLRGAGAYGVNGRMAEAVLLTLVNNEIPALELLDTFDTNDVATAAMVRALRARNTGDYRSLGAARDRTQIENVAWFSALTRETGEGLAWPKLTDEQCQQIDFVRAASHAYTVEIGHQLLAVALKLEEREIRNVYELSRGQN